MAWTDILSGIGTALGAAGTISDLFTSEEDRRAAQTPQFAYRPVEQTLSDADKIRAWMASNTQPITIPTRRLTSEEMNDPIFSPFAVGTLQKIKDDERAAQAAAPVAEAPVDDASTGLTDEQMRQIAGYDTPPGWDEKTQTYQTPFGQQIAGDKGRRAAENAALYAKTRDLTQRTFAGDRPDYSFGAQYAPLSTSLAAPLDRAEDEWTNPELTKLGFSPEDATYKRKMAIEALMRGDVAGMQEQRFRSGFDPKQGLLQKLKPLIVSGALAGIVGPAAAKLAGVGGLGLTGSAGNLAAKGLTSGIGDLFGKVTTGQGRR